MHRHMHVLFGTQFQEIHLLSKPIPESLDQYLDVNKVSFSAVAMEQWAKCIYPGGKSAQKKFVAFMNDLEFDQAKSPTCIR